MGNFPFHVSLHNNSSLLYFLIWVIHVISQLCIKNTYLKSNQSKSLKSNQSKTFQRFIYLTFIITYFSSSAARFINLSTFAPGSRKTKLGRLWWLFQRSRDPFGDEFRRLRYFREKINKERKGFGPWASQQEQISSYQWVIGVSLPLPP